MVPLLLRSSSPYVAAENAARVIQFFDGLMARRADLTTLVRQAALLADCEVGVRLARQPVGVMSDPSGHINEGGHPARATVLDLPDGGLVWLERSAPGMSHDELLLERLAVAASMVAGQRTTRSAGGDQAALIRRVLAAESDEGERSHALRRLGLGPRAPLQVVAVDSGTSTVSRHSEREGVRSARIGRLDAVLAAPGVIDLDGLALDHGRIGVGPILPGLEAPTAWQRARTALRLAVASPGHRDSIVHWEQLGALTLLIERLGPKDIEHVADVAALDEIVAAAGGADTLEVLDALCISDSVRRAAATVYRHHSTAAAHIHRAETVLGFSLTAAGRHRLYLAILLRRLRDAPDA